MKILMVGDIVGSPGRKVFAQVVARYRAEGEADFVVVNAENAAGGNGITADVAAELFRAGADVLTLGDHAWDQKPFQAAIDGLPQILRPANFAPGCPGRGLTTVSTPWGEVTVLNLIGRVFMKPYDCPFRKADELLNELGHGRRIVIVDMHAEATSEKIAMGRYLDGRVACVAGTHTHVQTSDEEVLPGGTAYLTDLGMTGAKDSVLGRDVEAVLASFTTGLPGRLSLAKDKVVLEGMQVCIDRETGRATGVRRIREELMKETASP